MSHIQVREQMFEGEGLLQICQDMHMSITGSSDPLPQDKYNRYKNILLTAVNKWQPNTSHWCGYDGAVYALICATLDEVNSFEP